MSGRLREHVKNWLKSRTTSFVRSNRIRIVTRNQCPSAKCFGGSTVREPFVNFGARSCAVLIPTL